MDGSKLCNKEFAYHIDPQRKTYTTALVYWTWLNKNKQYFVA